MYSDEEVTIRKPRIGVHERDSYGEQFPSRYTPSHASAPTPSGRERAPVVLPAMPSVRSANSIPSKPPSRERPPQLYPSAPSPSIPSIQSAPNQYHRRKHDAALLPSLPSPSNARWR
jgi:hypothetical protein